MHPIADHVTDRLENAPEVRIIHETMRVVLDAKQSFVKTARFWIIPQMVVASDERIVGMMDELVLVDAQD